MAVFAAAISDGPSVPDGWRRAACARLDAARVEVREASLEDGDPVEAAGTVEVRTQAAGDRGSAARHALGDRSSSPRIVHRGGPERPGAAHAKQGLTPSWNPATFL
jgi:hypothetical protein